MPDPAEQLTLTELLDRLPDNNRQLISPKDVRDIVATFAGQFGRLSILPGTGGTYPGNPGVWDELDLDDWVPSDENIGFDESAGNGRLTYTGTRPVLATANLSLSVAASPNDVLSFRVGINGVVEPLGESEISATVELPGQIVVLTTTASGIIQPGDFVSAFGRSDSPGNVDVITGHIAVTTQPV